MVNVAELRIIALSFPEVTEEPHFEKTSFRVKKKIFATFDFAKKRACLKLTLIEQEVFSLINKQVIYAVPNKWGKQGWTLFELEKIDMEVFSDALQRAYCNVAPEKLVKLLTN